MITTHVLDTAAGRPGNGIAIELEFQKDGIWNLIGGGGLREGVMRSAR